VAVAELFSLGGYVLCGIPSHLGFWQEFRHWLLSVGLSTGGAALSAAEMFTCGALDTAMDCQTSAEVS